MEYNLLKDQFDTQVELFINGQHRLVSIHSIRARVLQKKAFIYNQSKLVK